jgi:gamma-D-glutamyl-L-lysine dipeptidyl-peptidase
MVKPVGFQTVVFCKDALKVLFHKYFLMFIFSFKMKRLEILSYAFCCVPLSPLRKSPAHEAEMVNQLIFGEFVQVVETVKDWLKVRCKYDGYEGWCQSSQMAPADEAGYNQEDFFLTVDWVSAVGFNGQQMLVPLGSLLPVFRHGVYDYCNNTISFDGPVMNVAVGKADSDQIKLLAFKFLNTAYLWGGKTVFGTDCSGFTQTVFKCMNLKLPRDAYAQAETGTPVDFLMQARCGDLAFFDNEDGRIIHTGLLLNTQEIIHAAGKVRVDKIDNAGIIHTDSGMRTHRLRIIRRYF